MKSDRALQIPLSVQHDDDGETILIDAMDNEVCQVFAPDMESQDAAKELACAVNIHGEFVIILRKMIGISISNLIGQHGKHADATEEWIALKREARDALAKVGEL